tara:strand:+ start:108812 stop:108925 length:114 start_codon:yes stop_codon:yes gene_type:complete
MCKPKIIKIIDAKVDMTFTIETIIRDAPRRTLSEGVP